MAASAEIITKPIASAISLRWIIGARDDVIWFIGSVVSSYALFALYISGILPLIPMVALWAILIDAPHVFGTFSRTYFDRTERQNRSRLLWGSLLFFAVGPLMVLAGLGLIFFFLAALWAYYHLVKQHYGFMVLYKKKNNDLAPVDNALDRLLLLFAFNYPFVEFIARDPEAMARVPAALQSGVTVIDASAGGLGGCPYAKNATGNLATEDLVWMLHGLGIETGVDLQSLLATSLWMADRLGRPSPSGVVRALSSD